MRKLFLLLICVTSLLLGACQANATVTSVPPTSEQQPTEAAGTSAFLITNLADSASRDEVANILKKYLPEDNVNRFLEAVEDYNTTIRQTSLTQGFEPTVPEYDMAAISSLWKQAKGDYIGSNCRITAFTLFKDQVQIQKADSDAALLFLDMDAITSGKLFSAQETEQFKQLFSRVVTEKTVDVQVHAQKMRDHLAKIKFSDSAKMVAVVLHDNLDGDYLFIGHVGVLIEDRGEFIFIEKLSFEEPYQVIKFSREEDCYRYLYAKYADYADDGAANPFIMVNGELKCLSGQTCGE